MTAPAENPAPETPRTPSPADMPSFVAPPTPAAAEPEPVDDDQGNPAKPEADPEVARLKRENQNVRAQRREEREAREALEKALEELRAKHAESDDRWNKLAAFFNPEADAPPDPEKLAAQFAEERAQWDLKIADYDSKLSERDQKIRELSIRAALPTAAAKAKAHPDGLLKVLVADGVLGKLDPTAESFAVDLESAVKEAVENNPYLKVAQVATRSGAEIPGRTGGSDQLTTEQVKELARKDPEALVKAQKEGRLRNLGIPS